jgi:hypothetical protein
MENLGVLIPIIAVGGGVLITIIGMRQKHERDMAQHRGFADQARASDAEMMAEISRLKERVSVLERLATSDDRKLAEEINSLRHGDGARV